MDRQGLVAGDFCQQRDLGNGTNWSLPRPTTQRNRILNGVRFFCFWMIGFGLTTFGVSFHLLKKDHFLRKKLVD